MAEMICIRIVDKLTLFLLYTQLCQIALQVISFSGFLLGKCYQDDMTWLEDFSCEMSRQHSNASSK
jgi:hypothetical protein